MTDLQQRQCHYWSPDRIEAYRNEGGVHLVLLEAAALLYLDERDKLLCNISETDGEWPEGAGFPKGARKRLSVLYSIMQEHAESCVEQNETLDLIWGILHRTCKERGYTACVWSC